MKTVAVIAEYNPLHNGHQYHLQSIRRDFGEDTAIVVLMSGNYTQRGDVAIVDKLTRATCAVLGGADLVLELPFPFSMASAELFCRAGVSIAHAIGIVDVLSFGSECGDLDALTAVASRIDSSAFRHAFSEIKKKHPAIGHAKAMEEAYIAAFGTPPASSLSSPNDLLAIEYLRALAAHGGCIAPHTVRRNGASYHEATVGDTPYPSATALRSVMQQGGDLSGFVPSDVATLLSDAILRGDAPCDGEKLFPAILSSFMLNEPTASKAPAIHDAGGGLYDRLRRAGGEATSLSSWIAQSETKKYTRARLRRALWYAYFGVTSSDVKTTPGYTQLLGADALGRALLKRMRKTASIPILTKPSDTAALMGDALRQKRLSDQADRMFALTRPVSMPPASALRFTPYLKK